MKQQEYDTKSFVRKLREFNQKEYKDPRYEGMSSEFDEDFASQTLADQCKFNIKLYKSRLDIREGVKCDLPTQLFRFVFKHIYQFPEKHTQCVKEAVHYLLLTYNYLKQKGCISLIWHQSLYLLLDVQIFFQYNMEDLRMQLLQISIYLILQFPEVTRKNLSIANVKKFLHCGFEFKQEKFVQAIILLLFYRKIPYSLQKKYIGTLFTEAIQDSWPQLNRYFPNETDFWLQKPSYKIEILFLHYRLVQILFQKIFDGANIQGIEKLIYQIKSIEFSETQNISETKKLTLTSYLSKFIQSTFQIYSNKNHKLNYFIKSNILRFYAGCIYFGSRENKEQAGRILLNLLSKGQLNQKLFSLHRVIRFYLYRFTIKIQKQTQRIFQFIALCVTQNKLKSMNFEQEEYLEKLCQFNPVDFLKSNHAQHIAKILQILLNIFQPISYQKDKQNSYIQSKLRDKKIKTINKVWKIGYQQQKHQQLIEKLRLLRLSENGRIVQKSNRLLKILSMNDYFASRL